MRKNREDETSTYGAGRLHNIQRLCIKCCRLSKISNKVGKIIISPNRVRYFRYTTTLYAYSMYLSTSDLSRFIISNTDKLEFFSIWKWLSCFNDVMNDVDCVIKRDAYLQKMHLCSKNIRDISVFLF